MPRKIEIAKIQDGHTRLYVDLVRQGVVHLVIVEGERGTHEGLDLADLVLLEDDLDSLIQALLVIKGGRTNV